MYECFLPSSHYYGYGSHSLIVIVSDEVIEFMRSHKLDIRHKNSDKKYKLISINEAINGYGFNIDKPYIEHRNKFIVYGEDRDSILLFRLSF